MSAAMPSGKWEVIGPGDAIPLLQTNTDQQRALKTSVVAKYARDMAEGKWQAAGDPVRIDINGKLVDGQHRMNAIVAAGKPQIMFVMRGVSPDAFHVIDTGAKRSPYDSLVTTGRGCLVDGIPPNVAAGTIAAMLSPQNIKGRETRSELLLFADRHEEALKWTFDQFKRQGTPSRRVLISPVMAAVARAFYHVRHDKLAEFVRVLVTGVPVVVDRDRGVLAFRNWIVDLRTISNSNGRGEIYLKTARSITAYERGETPSKIMAASSDPFPLPSEDDVTMALQFVSAH